MPDIVLPDEHPFAGTDEDATAEENAIGEDKLAAQRRLARFRRHSDWIALGALWVIATIAFLIAFAILYHLLLPEKWHYLGAAQLRDLRSVALTAVTSAAAVRYFRRLAD